VGIICDWSYNPSMVRLIAIFFVLLVPHAGFAQQSRTPVYVSHTGQDRVGSLFEAALKQELSRSTRYVPRHYEGTKTKFEFHIDLSTVDVADNRSEEGKRSVVSVVIEDFGLPNSYPVATMWYHKLIVVDKNSVGTVAKDLLDDMDARWCNHIKSSVGGCPKEKFYPQL
jgi:hypothetical protein